MEGSEGHIQGEADTLALDLPLSTKDLETDYECPICLTAMNTCGKDIVILQCCKNKMHLSCYMECINVSKSCPFCRRTIQQQFNSQPHSQQQHIVAIVPPDNELIQLRTQNDVYRRKVQILCGTMLFMYFAYYIAGRFNLVM